MAFPFGLEDTVVWRSGMYDAITDVEGIEVGHAQSEPALTGCTVVLCLPGATVGVDVRGLAPGTRETDLCRPGTLVERAQAILLAGGSAFGLDAAAGVMRYLLERGAGFETGVLNVPIVPAAVIFDLGIGEAAWPGPDEGYSACLAAAAGPVVQGNVGAGTGASVGKLLGMGLATKSGLGSASVRIGEVTVGALMVVNAFGNVLSHDSTTVLAGVRDPDGPGYLAAHAAIDRAGSGPAALSNTTIGVVATDATLTANEVARLASWAHDGLARRIQPVHTLFDGDTVFGLATGRRGGSADSVRLTMATTEAVERAVTKAVLAASPAGGLPAARPGD